MVVKGNFSSLPLLNKNIKVCLEWDVSRLMGHVVFCKRLRDEGLHKFLDMARYCMKDNGEGHYEFVHHNVSANDMSEGKLEYAKFKKVGLNNRASLSHSNIKGLINGFVLI